MDKRILGGLLAGLGIALLANGKKGTVQLDPEQETFVQNLHSFAQTYFRQFITQAQQKTGWKIIFTSGYRTFAKQLQLKQENSNNASPGNSWHNYGMAIDVNLEKNGVRIKKADSIATWNSTGVPQIAVEMGMVWGGNFSSYHDPVHFDLRSIIQQKLGYSISDLKQKAFAQFGTTWSNIQGNKVTI